MKIRHVDHIGIVVKNLAAAKAFFVDLGFTVVGEAKVQGKWVERIIGLNDVRADVVMIQAPDGQLNLELAKFHQPVDQEGIRLASPNTLGLRHIAFVVEDIEGIVDTLKQKGRELVGEIQTYEDSYRLCYVRGPEGIIVELAEQIGKNPMSQKNEAEKRNPILQPFKVLIGKWDTVGTHPYVPGKTFHGRTTFEWIEEGAFLLMRSEIDEPEIPSGVAIFGSDNVTKEFFMLYFDERDISRKYDVSFTGNVMQWRRSSPEFSQRMVLTIAEDGKTIVSKGEMRKNTGAWEKDLELTYTRI